MMDDKSHVDRPKPTFMSLETLRLSTSEWYFHHLDNVGQGKCGRTGLMVHYIS
jgi:hypothetical protein